MANYFQPYDPNSYSVQGYQLPSQEIAGALNAKTQYYIQGLQNIKERHDQAFDMQLTNEQNITSLNNQRAQVEQSLKDITNKDLSIGDYQRQAMDMFKPITNNRSFLADEHLTAQKMSALSQAQSDVKTKGSSYVNTESVKAINNSLEDMRTADTSDPNWYSSFMNDTLANTYIPYDPKVDKEWTDNLQKFIKDTKSKYSQPQTRTDGNGNPSAYYLSEQEISTQTDEDLRQYVKNNRPQQQLVQSQLVARNLKHDLQSYQKQDPINGRAYAIQYLDGVKQNALNSEVGIINRTVNNIAAKQGAIASPDSDAFKSLEAYKKQLIGEDGKGGYMKTVLDHYNSIHPEEILDNPANTADLAELLDDTKVNTQIQALGLDQVKETLKADQSSTSILNNRENIQARLQLGALKAETERMKKEGKNADGSRTPNPNITQSEDLGTNPTLSGAEKLKDVQTRMLVKEDDIRKQLLSLKYAAVVPVDGENKNVIDVMNLPQYKDMRFDEFLDKVQLPQSTRELLEALNADVYTHNSLKGTTRAFTTKDAATRIMTALYDDKTMSQVLLRAGYEKGGEDDVASLGIALQDLKNNRQQLANSFGEPIRKVITGLKDFENLTNEQLVNMDEKSYTERISGQLKAQGFSNEDIKSFQEYLQTGHIIGTPISQGSSIVGAGSVFGNNPINYKAVTIANHPDIAKYKQEWDKFQKLREDAIAQSGNHILSNTASFQVVPTSMNSKEYDPNSMIYEGQIPSLLSRASTSLNGVNQDAELDKAFQQVKGQLGQVVKNVQVFDDNTDNPYIRLNIDIKDAKQFLTAGKLEGVSNLDDLVEKMNSTRFYIPKEDLSKYGFTQQSTVGLDFAGGQPVNYNLTSGNKISFRNAGMGGETSIVPDGRVSHINVYKDGTIEVADGDKLTPELMQSFDPSGGILKATQIAPKEVARQLYVLDYRAALLKNIMQSNGFGTKANIRDLQNLKEKDKVNNLFILSGGTF
jgi:hypothetical protein